MTVSAWLRRLRLPRNPFRQARGTPWLGLVAVPAVTAVAVAVWFAATGPVGRAAAVVGSLSALASVTAALTALYLSRQALSRTDLQLAHARRVTMLSRYPLLLPVHQSVSFPASSGLVAAHPPTVDRFTLHPPEPGTYAFVADARDRFVVPVENAGEGPALRVQGTLWHRDGRTGSLVGPTVVGAGRTAVFTTRLDVSSGEPPADFRATKQGNRGGVEAYWLEMSYVDVFGNRLGSHALFDPRGLGAWHVTVVGDDVTNLGPPATLPSRGAVDGQM